MNKKQQGEKDLIKRFLKDLGCSKFSLETGDKPDIIAVIDGRKIGIEQTTYHDDGCNSGSNHRACAEKNARSKQTPPTMAINIDPVPAILERIKDKIYKSRKYDTEQYSELWLLISAQVPTLGMIAPTHLECLSLDTDKLNNTSHSILNDSPFTAAYIHLVNAHNLFSWSSDYRWSMVRFKR
ncbi:hypothetical protein HAP94_08815 [Acidithiobacillus ferrivorans]|nr:hypothetical protein [Acidithiobacillus ferrivorans]